MRVLETILANEPVLMLSQSWANWMPNGKLYKPLSQKLVKMTALGHLATGGPDMDYKRIRLMI